MRRIILLLAGGFLLIAGLTQKPIVVWLVLLHQSLHHNFHPLCPVCIEYLRGMIDQWKESDPLSVDRSSNGRVNGYLKSLIVNPPIDLG